MEELRWWSRLLMVSGIVAVVLLIVGPLGYKFGLSALQPSLVSLLLALLGGALVFLLSAIMCAVAHFKHLTRNRNLLVIAMAIGLVPVVVMAPQIAAAQSVPPIHDITTDPEDPPGFVRVVELRKNAANDLVYATEEIPHAEMAELQRKAYPDVVPLRSELAPGAAVARAAEVLRQQGLEIVNVDAEAGIVEATATTFWFGFKDDLVVRVRPAESGSVIDVRSVSRIGQSDIGANAKRIVTFLDAMARSG